MTILKCMNILSDLTVLDFVQLSLLPVSYTHLDVYKRQFRADATDIHIEPFKKYTRIRVRVNGDLIELMNVSNVVHNSLATRLKLISGMNIAEKRLPQDGRFTQGVDGVTLDAVSYTHLKMNNTIKSAMMYPMILLVLSIVIVIGMFTFIMPTFIDMFEDPSTMPTLTKGMLAISDFLTQRW